MLIPEPIPDAKPLPLDCIRIKTIKRTEMMICIIFSKNPMFILSFRSEPVKKSVHQAQSYSRYYKRPYAVKLLRW